MVNVTFDDSKSIVSTDSSGKVNVYSPGDIAWTLASTALVWIMIPGVGFFYSGLLRRKNALSMIYLSTMTFAVVSLQWFFWGYSLVYSETGNKYIGDLRHIVLRGVLDQPAVASDRIPAIVFCVYQLMFATFTPMLAIGAVAERGRLGPLMVFVFLWATIVYDPIAHWIWSPNGWSYKLGGIDFAGGNPVHISSGLAALAISRHIGPRRDNHAYSPNNTAFVCLGTAMMWFGWIGFNGGSALSANMRAANAVMVTNLAASSGGLTWAFLDYWRLTRRWSAVAFCSGAISGLVAITPGAGYVSPASSVLFGVVAGIVCNLSTQIPVHLGIDDALDIFASHGIGGLVGNILTGIFAQASIAGLDGYTSASGWINKHFIQLGYQLADSTAGIAYAFVMTTIIVMVMDFSPWLSLRVAEEDEQLGIDETQMGELIEDPQNAPVVLAAAGVDQAAPSADARLAARQPFDRGQGGEAIPMNRMPRRREYRNGVGEQAV